ncbi:beta-ketoacyl-ACP synthase [Consotaella aegiceratis]|uniref:beta-ketoacyl-ACP synthase n=1 Tax=Consotaella aegiceratis TaxID=3097961 RepID=UPI002F3ECE6D
MTPAHDVLITGIGLVSSLGEGIAAHADVLFGAPAPRPVVERERFAPYFVHPLPPVDWSSQIPKKGDQRQMETWQRLGTFAAGLALDDASVAKDEAERATVDMIVAAGGGERDPAVDALVMERSRGLANPQPVINETLGNELRPTLFLAQLSNLLAGNISIVHKVTGSSRTFMGEEGAGISAIATAARRIAAGQSQICLVGGAYSAERKDLLHSYALGGFLLSDEWRPVLQRDTAEGGFAPGAVGAFLVLESAEHAAERGVRAYARLGRVAADRGRRDGDRLKNRLGGLLDELDLAAAEDVLVLSGASGVAGITQAERDVLGERLPGAPLRAYETMLGHSFEAQFPAGIALAALALSRGASYAAFDARSEAAATLPPKQALVTTVGHVQAEGVCLLHAADEA